MRISDLVTFLTEGIFRLRPEQIHNPFLRWAARQYKLLFYTVQGLSTHGTMVRSAAMTFYTLISIVPIVALIFAVLKGFGMTEDLVQNLYGLLPQMPEVVDYVVDFAQNTLARTQGGWVAAISLVTLFWAVIRVFGSIEDAFNNIWEVKNTRSMARKYSDYITVVVLAPILWIVATSFATYTRQIFGVDDSMWLKVGSEIGSMAIVWLMFTFIYIIIPNTKVQFSAALMAGIIAGSIFLGFQWGYLYLQKWMTSYNAIYGSFAALPLFLLWMQTSWEILLLGGELSFAYQNEKRFEEERQSLMSSHDCRRKLMVGIMTIVVEWMRQGRGPIPVAELRERMEIPTRILSNLLFSLTRAGMLGEVHISNKEYDVAYVPTRDISTLRVYDIIEAVEREGLDFEQVEMERSTQIVSCATTVDLLKSLARKSEENKLIIDLIENNE
ncbi:MAG: YihY family inner membrane protein [Alistipes sp.]|nr:YihY family inner membrane protein [Alistipes sp.]MBQ5622692.1 YihY family inner membrane protein [Alistipes sp.]MBQ5785101.1 YihY family inner membrane protein [Alistipes sp.]MBQ5915018.1 YihY family inner membrane protein [Alistipes sp.]MBR5801843.1 YihY family inner membrane protein [Alistipes sp.]